MRTLALTLVSASLLALTACGDAGEANNTSANTLGTETLPPIDSNLGDLNTTTDLNATGTTSLDTNLSANVTTGNESATTNTVGNSQ